MKTTCPGADDDDYQVGYGKPPKHTRFPKGRSGNSKGRPRKLKSLNELFANALAKEVEINGKKITKQELIVEALIQHAAKGKPAAMNIVLGHLSAIEGAEPPEFDPALADQAALTNWLKNLGIHNPENDVS